MTLRRTSSALCFALPVFAAVTSLAAGPAYAQTTSGEIIGVVTDPTSALIPGVRITVRNTETNVVSTAVTGKSGSFEVLQLPIGSYTVTAEKDGFTPTTTPPYQIEINQVRRVDFKLPLLGQNQTVEVTINSSAVDTVSATVGGSVTERPLVDLPLNGRNVLDLASLQPGVVNNAQQPGNGSAGTVSIAGGRTDSVTYLLDGGNNTSLLNNQVVFTPNPDAVEEYRILENNYAAEYGRNGGGVISVVSKSGTDKYHGSVFEFARNRYFNANDFFTKRAGAPKNDLKRHQFGGTFGGELFIPRLLPRKDKYFYFFSYEGQRQTESDSIGSQQVATTAEVQNGDFSGADPGTVSAVAAFLQANPYFQADPVKAAAGIMDPTKFDPVAQKYIAAGIFPYSNSGFVFSTAPIKNNFDQYNAKFDFILTDKDHLSVSAARNKNPNSSPFAGGDTTAFPVQNDTLAYILNIDETHQFGPNILNDARVVAQRLNTTQAFPLETLPTPAQLGIGITPDQATGPTILSFYDSGANYGFSPQGPTTLINNTFAYTDDLTYVRGHHSMKAGIYFSPYQNNTKYDFYVDGDFSFYGLGGSASGFAEFLAGDPDNYLQFGAAPSNIRSKATAAYAQDQWQVFKNLSLTYGLRYEFSTPKSDTQGRSFSLVPGAQSTRFVNAPRGLLFPGDKGAPTGANFPVKDNFAPRFGVAYDIGGKGRTVVRAGTGLFYDILKGEDNLQFNGQAPFFGYENLYFTQPTGATGPLNYYEDPFAATGTVNTFPSKKPAQNIDFDASGFLPFGGGGVFFVDPHLRTPYTIQFNGGIQQAIGNGIVAEVAYVGSVSRKYTALIDSNPFILGTTNRVYEEENGNPVGSLGDPGYNYLETFKNITNENYNSLQASLRKPPTHTAYIGTTYFQLSYTFSKNMDNVSGFRQRNSVVPSYNPSLFYAVSDTNVPHRIVLSGGWDLPFDEYFKSAPKAITKGWSLSPIASYQSGFPLDIFNNLQQSFSNPGPTGAGDQELVRVNLVVPKVQKLNPYSSVAADGGAPYLVPGNFSTNVTSGYGTLPRNSFYGPSRTNVDMSVIKETTLHGGDHPVRFQFRGDFFNLFNITQFQSPNTNPFASNFGEITQTYTDTFRIIQLAAKLQF
jgi:outer membrane receptor protein involved in Fe transport